jgi:hypothetical protein
VQSNTSASDIGFAIGAAGGNIADAAKVQYILSRVLKPGEQPSPTLIAQIVAMMSGNTEESIIAGMLSQQKK